MISAGWKIPSSASVIVVLAILLAVSPGWCQEKPQITFDGGCFPTCDTTDSRFLVIASGAALETLSEEPLNLKFAVNRDAISFKIEIFDGDSMLTDASGQYHWDIGVPNPLRFTLYTDPTGLMEDRTLVSTGRLHPSHGPVANPFEGQVMPDNDWFTLVIDTGAEARAEGSGNYFYVLALEPELMIPEPESSLNSVKVRTSESVYLSVLEQPFAFIAEWTNVADLGIIYPELDMNSIFSPSAETLERSTYDGTFTFFVDVPALGPEDQRTELKIFDGDLDLGHHSGVLDQDTADADSPATLAELPFGVSPLAMPEGIALGENGTTGAPSDNGDPEGPSGPLAGLNKYIVRNPSVAYRVNFPSGTDPGTIVCREPENRIDPVRGGIAVLNANPSGNREWEQFKISTDPFDPALMDCHVDHLPTGTYRVDLIGMDMNNLNAWFFGEDTVCVRPNGDPCETYDRYMIGDTVWEDPNGNGIQEVGEPGIPGVIAYLLDSGGDIQDETVTDENGLYSFDVSAAQWTVEIASENFVGGTPGGAVGDRVWLDADADGEQDALEPGIANVLVSLYDAGVDGMPGGSNDVHLTNRATDTNGNYLFSGLAPGSYYTMVSPVTIPYGLMQSGGSNPSEARMITAAEVFLDLDFGYAQPGPADSLVGDYVWLDADADGVQDPGESGIGGVVLELIETTTSLVVDTEQTNGDGSYLFAGVLPGSYRVNVVDSTLPPGLSLTSGPGSNPDPTLPFSVLAGSSHLDKDFGYVAPLYTISDTVWLDIDRNGSFDGAETGIPGVTVELLGPTGDVIAATTTDPSGNFSFPGLRPAAYSLAVTDLSLLLSDLLPTTPPANRRSLAVTIETSDMTGVNFGFATGGALEDTTATTESPTQTNTVVDANILTYDFGYLRACFPCEGKVSWLTLRFDGASGAQIRVESAQQGELFNDWVEPGGVISLIGPPVGNPGFTGTLGTEIYLYIDEVFDINIHTSCSAPIGPGMTFGSFYVVAGESNIGGLLCPADFEATTRPVVIVGPPEEETSGIEPIGKQRPRRKAKIKKMKNDKKKIRGKGARRSKTRSKPPNKKNATGSSK